MFWHFRDISAINWFLVVIDVLDLFFQDKFMFAILSDIHSNLEALNAVLKDIKKRGIKTVYCLGDVIGYGPNPRECLDLIIEKTQWCVLGNHDFATYTNRQISTSPRSRQASGPAKY